MTPEVVLDASVAVKWTRDEPGSDEARRLLEDHLLGNVDLWMPEQSLAELLAVVMRDKGPGAISPTWQLVHDAGISMAPLGPDLVEEAARQCDSLGCAFYDALAPALSVLLGGTLYSADARAHGRFPGVQLLG